MKRSYVIAVAATLFVICASLTESIAQRRSRRRPAPAVGQAPSNPPANQQLKCTQSTLAANEPMTYLVGASTLSREDRERIGEKWGTLTIPKGETERAKGIRAAALAYEKGKVDTYNKKYDEWIANNPNATAEQKREWRALIDTAIEEMKATRHNTERLARKTFDWREVGLDVGPVMNQGEGCNTCWAFACAAAAGASLDKNSLNKSDQIYNRFDPVKAGVFAKIQSTAVTWTTKPFVQELLNCMPIKKEEICNSGWHGTAFDFMVYKRGIPLVEVDDLPINRLGKPVTEKREYKAGQKFECKPNSFIKANAWDYVNSPPDKLPTVEQLKTALIEHGPLVAPIFYDDCLGAYRGGVFNERDNGMINHVVLLIGWDDQKQAWLVKNSYGEEWGEKGFGWIKYGSNNIGLFAAWIEATRE